jgi:predicted O-methyltransferase YrrM
MKFEFDENWHENQVPVLKEKFLPLWEGKKDLRALEIGSFEGRSTVWWLDNMDIKEMVCIDTWEGGEEHSHIDMNKVFENFKANVGDKVEWHQGYSHDILMDLIKEGRKFDFIYVDGSHRARMFCSMPCYRIDFSYPVELCTLMIIYGQQNYQNIINQRKA